MLDTYSPNGIKLHIKDNCVTAVDEMGKIMGSYHPMQGDVVFGVRSPQIVCNIMEALEYGRRFVSRD